MMEIFVVLLVVLPCLFLIGGIAIGARWERRDLMPMADMLTAITKVETADRALFVEEGQAEFDEAKNRYVQRQPTNFTGSRLSWEDLHAWQRRIDVRDREVRDGQFKPTAQDYYNEMVSGDQTQDRLASLCRGLRSWMEKGGFKLTDFGHPHNDVEIFLMECGAKASAASVPAILSKDGPLQVLDY